MIRTAFLAALVLAAAPAIAQDAGDALPDPNDNSDTVTVAAGAAYLPDYEGSNDYRFIPAAALRGRLSGISFSTKATWLYVDVVPRGAGKLDLDLGPIIGVRPGRSSKVDDRLVRLLPKRKAAFEVGGFGGVTFRGLTNPYDGLGVHLDVVRDIGNAHQSTVFTPNIDFATPLSRTFYASASLSADIVSDRYARYYFGVTPAESLATGLPVFTPGGGLKSWKLGLLANQSLSGDLTRGWALFGAANYSKLRGDFKRSPLVSQRGSATQWLAAAGLAYTF